MCLVLIKNLPCSCYKDIKSNQLLDLNVLKCLNSMVHSGVYSDYIEGCFIHFMKIKIINFFHFSPVMEMAIRICQKGIFYMELVILNSYYVDLCYMWRGDRGLSPN